jgi:NAD(P)-dependent dehydrogenase (short-subunit alcohol dehydrogenase family)
MSNPPIALVTGTSSGIGLHTAVGLAQAGLQVVATVRDLDGAGPLRAAAQAADVELDIRRLDVTDEASAVALIADLGRVEVLVNNAGLPSRGTLEELTLADLRAQLEVNYLAVAGLTRLVLPAMRVAQRGRVVTVTSLGGVIGQPFNDAYCGAKFAVEGLMQSLAPVVARFGVQISVVEPGAVNSGFNQRVRVDQAGSGNGDDPYAQLRDAHGRVLAGAAERAQTPLQAAQVVVEAATTAEPKFRWQTSRFATAFAGLSIADLDGSRVLGATSAWLD